MAWNDPIKLPGGELGIDFEAEIAMVTGDVPLAVSSAEAPKHIKLFVLLNDICLLPRMSLVIYGTENWYLAR